MAAAQRLRVLVSGASGVIGTALIDSMQHAGLGLRPEIVRLVRHKARGKDEIEWDPYEMRIDIDKLDGFDAVVHLAGENVGSGDSFLTSLTGRWSERKKHMIMESRRRGTQLLCKSLAAVASPPKVLVSMSGVGYYGSRGDEVLDESASKGEGFLSDVADAWERETAPLSEAGTRVVHTRTGVVLTTRGGMILRLYMPYLFGLGGPVGGGSQWLSWLTLGDAVRGIRHILQRPELEGVVNLTAPEPCTSAEFASAFGRVLSRPAILPLPTAAVKTVFGEMGEETLLVSQRAVPKALLESGFVFRCPDIERGLRAAIDRNGGAGRE